MLCASSLCVRTRRGLSRPTASKSPASFPAKPYNYIICIFDRIIGFSKEFRFSRPDKVLHRLLDIASQLGDRTPSSFWLHHTKLRTKSFTACRLVHLRLRLITHSPTIVLNPAFYGNFYGISCSTYFCRARLNKSCPNVSLIL